MMDFKERGYDREFGYGPFGHGVFWSAEKNEALIPEGSIFGPDCQDDYQLQFRLKGPGRTDRRCSTIWEAMAAYLSDCIGRDVKADSADIETATRQALEAMPEIEQDLQNMMLAIISFWIMLPAMGNRTAAKDLAKTSNANLVLDIPAEAAGGQELYWGTAAGEDGAPIGKNVYGQLLKKARSRHPEGMLASIICEQGYTITH